jgi:hypothetical protein
MYCVYQNAITIGVVLSGFLATSRPLKPRKIHLLLLDIKCPKEPAMASRGKPRSNWLVQSRYSLV